MSLMAFDLKAIQHNFWEGKFEVEALTRHLPLQDQFLREAREK